MKKYVNNEGKEIFATEKAFNTLYKHQGYEPASKKKIEDESTTELKEVSKGVYELPNGEQVKGKKNAESRLKELKGE
ncbi:hypothetical protein V7122_21710 [Bacillus sp. JJ1532]|uniref:hypothetical protein n=1 Tax=Bacillus sp. JJ1532 TaxID=3122958 RepID=UPI002FFEA709